MPVEGVRKAEILIIVHTFYLSYFLRIMYKLGHVTIILYQFKI